MIESRDVYGGSQLISNEGAEIGNNLLLKIVEIARTLPEWQKPMAVRKKLPASIAKDLAEFVDASVRELLMSRTDFDETTTEEVAAVFRRRVDFADAQPEETPHQRLKRLVKENALTEETISDALAMRDRDFATLAVAHMAKTTPLQVTKIFDMGAPKPIVALAYHAGLSMRMALTLQKGAGKIPPKEIIYPKGGTDYPLTEEELNWQLEFLGLKAGA